MLVTLHALLAAARRDRFALGTFNTYNMEITSAIIGAAEEVRAPVIVQIGATALRGANGVALPALTLALARAAMVPVVVHLDHAPDVHTIGRALRNGYSSVMIDASAEPFAENIALTREATRRGYVAGVTVEGELGGIAGDEDVATSADGAVFTDPEQAERFVAETEIDLLAIAIGNAHGLHRGKPELRFGLLEQLRDRVPVPLVLHGASGPPDDAIHRAIALGVTKTNFNTELRQALFGALERELSATRVGYDVAALLGHVTTAVKASVMDKLILPGAAKRAGEFTGAINQRG
ncbi:MAG: class II fructose-1,6-bisphosphate aldolase [Chloroflexota bacterium]